jgi:hypothetical protein
MNNMSGSGSSSSKSVSQSINVKHAEKELWNEQINCIHDSVVLSLLMRNTSHVLPDEMGDTEVDVKPI